jgi:hypothetical protein
MMSAAVRQSTASPRRVKKGRAGVGCMGSRERGTCASGWGEQDGKARNRMSVMGSATCDM